MKYRRILCNRDSISCKVKKSYELIRAGGYCTDAFIDLSGGNPCYEGACDEAYQTYRFLVVQRRQNKPWMRRRTVPLNTTVGARNVSPTRWMGQAALLGYVIHYQGKIYSECLFISALSISFFTLCHMRLSIPRLLFPTT